MFVGTWIDEDEALDFLLEMRRPQERYPQALLILADYYQMKGLFEVAEMRSMRR